MTLTSEKPTTGAEGAVDLQPCTLREVVLNFLRLGTVGFGGPIALAGYMQRDLVEQKRWFSEQAAGARSLVVQ